MYVFLQQPAVVLHQFCNGVLCKHIEADLALHCAQKLVCYLLLTLEEQHTICLLSPPDIRTHLVLPVVSLAVLDDFVAELEEVAHVFVPLVCQVCHGEESLSAVLEGDLEQMEDLWRRRRLGMYAWRE